MRREEGAGQGGVLSRAFLPSLCLKTGGNSNKLNKKRTWKQKTVDLFVTQRFMLLIKARADAPTEALADNSLRGDRASENNDMECKEK